LNARSLTPPSKEEQRIQWHNLSQIVEQQGLLEKQYLYYAGKILLTLCLLLGNILCLAIIDNPWIQIANALFLAFVFAQILLIGHSAGHGQIFRSPGKNDLISFVIGLVVGLSRSWWNEKHNIAHHGSPNVVGVDTDIDISVLALSKEQAIGKRGLYRFVTRYQSFFFFPILFLQGVSFRSASVLYLLRPSIRKQPVKKSCILVELVLILVHLAGYALLLLFFLDHWWHLILFAVIHQGFMGLYMGSIFAPNHKGMFMPDKNSRIGFLWRQVPTARNVKNPWLFDFWFGGLNYQIEHHLFTDMPQNKLREAQKIVKIFCKDHDIPYSETGFFQTYKEILEYLRAVSAPLRQKIA
jgi:fatty acid desaturase